MVPLTNRWIIKRLLAVSSGFWLLVARKLVLGRRNVIALGYRESYGPGVENGSCCKARDLQEGYFAVAGAWSQLPRKAALCVAVPTCTRANEVGCHQCLDTEWCLVSKGGRR